MQVRVVGVSYSFSEPLSYQGHQYWPQQVGDVLNYPALVAYAQRYGSYVKIVKKIVYFLKRPEVGEVENIRLI